MNDDNNVFVIIKFFGDWINVFYSSVVVKDVNDVKVKGCLFVVKVYVEGFYGYEINYFFRYVLCFFFWDYGVRIVYCVSIKFIWILLVVLGWILLIFLLSLKFMENNIFVNDLVCDICVRG